MTFEQFKAAVKSEIENAEAPVSAFLAAAICGACEDSAESAANSDFVARFKAVCHDIISQIPESGVQGIAPQRFQ